MSDIIERLRKAITVYDDGNHPVLGHLHICTEAADEIERLRAERDTAQRVFRALRAAWFASHLRSNAHEREWEDEEHEQRRHERNAKLLARYASQTEGILNGEDWPVFPTCAADMDMTNASAAGGGE